MAHVPGQPEIFTSPGLPGTAQEEAPACPRLDMLSGAPASEETVQVWLPSPEKKLFLVVAKREVSGDPVIKYTSLSCGPRNPRLKADQFPAPGGMMARSHPETDKHHPQTLDVDLASSRGKREE